MNYRRFTSVDPLWEKYTGWTGYQYSLNNPVNYLDKDGRDIEVAYRKAGTYSLYDPGHIALAIFNEKGEITNSWSFTPKDNSIIIVYKQY